VEEASESMHARSKNRTTELHLQRNANCVKVNECMTSPFEVCVKGVCCHLYCVSIMTFQPSFQMDWLGEWPYPL